MRKKILVVDDDQLVLYGLQKALNSEACEISTAVSAALAMEKFKTCSYDLCLLDIHLTDCDGLQLMKKLKKICPTTKIIIMTASFIHGNELGENIQNALAKDAYYLIPKPFELWQVKNIVMQAMQDEKKTNPVDQISNNENLQKRRKLPRKPCSKDIGFSMSVIYQGSYQRWTIKAKIVDRCDLGVGLLTHFPLKITQILSFNNELASRTGVVVWSTMIDDQTCRAGIKFA